MTLRPPFPAPSGRASTLTVALAALAALGLGACGGDGRSSSPPPARASERDGSPLAVALRAAIEDGDPDRAEELLAAAGPALGVERPCLAARIAFLRGDEGAWLRAIEEARALAPADPRPYATASELWSAAGRLDAARRELERGLAAVGELAPELERAKAVLALVTPGGARAGLARARNFADELHGQRGLGWTSGGVKRYRQNEAGEALGNDMEVLFGVDSDAPAGRLGHG